MDIENLLQRRGKLLETIDALRGELLSSQLDLFGIHKRLERLGVDLSKHFEYEKESGFFSHVVKLAPRLKIQAETLQHEHQELVDLLAEINRQVKDNVKAVPPRIDLGGRFVDFAHRLQRHEHQKCGLLLRAYDHNIGAED